MGKDQTWFLNKKDQLDSKLSDKRSKNRTKTKNEVFSSKRQAYSFKREVLH